MILLIIPTTCVLVILGIIFFYKVPNLDNPNKKQ